MKTLLKNGLVLTLNKDRDLLPCTDVLVCDGKIAAIGRDLECEADRVIDCTDKLVMPGLINSHAHSDENMFRGLFDNLPLEQWMLYSCPPLAYGPFSERLIYLRTMTGAIEMLKQGVTCVQDDVSECPNATLAGYDQVFGAYKDLGMKANVAVNMGNREYCDKLPFAREVFPKELQDGVLAGHPDPDEMLALYRKVLDKWDRRDGLKVVLSSSAPQRCTDDYLLRLKKLAEEYDTPMHTHILETRMQLATGPAFYGESIVKHIDTIGFISDRLTIIHCVWTSDEDMEIIARAGASVAHNPVSNLKLGSGIMPMLKMLEHGVNVVIGTDGISSNDSQSVFEGMKFAALLPKITHPDYNRWPDSRTILDMATKNAAYSLRRTDELASLEVGKSADIAVLDLLAPAFSPLNDIYNHLVYCESGSDVDLVMVAGNVVVENGKVLTVDEKALMRELHEISGDFKERFKYSVEKNTELKPYVDAIYDRCIEQAKDYNYNLFS